MNKSFLSNCKIALMVWISLCAIASFLFVGVKNGIEGPVICTLIFSSFGVLVFLLLNFDHYIGIKNTFVCYFVCLLLGFGLGIVSVICVYAMVGGWGPPCVWPLIIFCCFISLLVGYAKRSLDEIKI